jgi:hypothetical protein
VRRMLPVRTPRGAPPADAPAAAAPAAAAASPAAAAPARPLRPRRLGGGPGVRQAGARSSNSLVVSALLYLITHVALVVAGGLIIAHLVFAMEEHPLPFRICTAIPGVLAILEIRRYVQSTSDELPFLALGLLQYYIAFSFPLFFPLEFGDLTGYLYFTPDVRLQGGFAIGLGALCLWGAARVAIHVSGGAVPTLLRILPPSEMPPAWRRVFVGYAVGVLVLALVQISAPSAIPGTLATPLGLAMSAEMPLVLALACPPGFRGALGRYLNLLLALLGAVRGLLSGMLEPLFRMAMPYLTGTWAFTRRFSVSVLVGLMAVYLVLQPVKAGYRAQVWGTIQRTGQDVGYMARVDAWVTSFQGVWSNEKTDTQELNRSSIERLSEQGPVMHAFHVLPGRVKSLEGAGLLVVFNSLIPRFIWPDKPTVGETVLQYAVIFGRQTERGTRTTGINLPLLVEGYWNLGWPGIVLVTGLVGASLGFLQRVFTGKHWAFRALGLAQLTRVSVTTAMVVQIGAFVQSTGVLILTLWALWASAKFLSGRERPRVVVGRRAIRLAAR